MSTSHTDETPAYSEPTASTSSLRSNALLIMALSVVIPLASLGIYSILSESALNTASVVQQSATATPLESASPQESTSPSLHIETYVPEQEKLSLSVQKMADTSTKSKMTSLHLQGAPQTFDINAPSGPTHAFDEGDVQDDADTQNQTGLTVIHVDGEIVATVASAADYQAVRKALLDPYTKPVAGGKPWKRSFTNDVETSFADDDRSILSVEDAVERLRPLLHVKLREKVFTEMPIAFAIIQKEDDALPEGQILIETEGKDGVRQEVHEVISVDGKEIERNLLGTRVLEKPISQVEKVGVGKASHASSVRSTQDTSIPEEEQSPSFAPSPTPTETATPTPSYEETASPAADNTVPTPEETPAPTATKRPQPADDGTWPSSSFSAFNFPVPGDTWYSDPSMGAGKNYPGIDLTCETTVSGQGVRGPSAPVSFSCPVSASVSSHFGWRPSGERIHYGTDYAASLGTPIKAAARGTVTWYTKEGDGAFGNVVEINHGGGFTTLYAHCDSIDVAEGDRVNADDIIGAVGGSGAAAVHLHFEVRYNGIAYNPAFYLN